MFALSAFRRFASTPGPFRLAPLPFAKNALAPHISEETLDFHWGKHHQAYVTKLNELVSAPNFKTPGGGELTLDNIVKAASPGVLYNQAAQVWNHDFYWNSLSPNGGGAPTGDIADRINQQWGSFEKFKEEFSAKCAGHFGSGWVWLLKDNKTNELRIVDTHDAVCPITEFAQQANPDWKDTTPLLVCDVWEHAYYVDRRNARPAYIEAFWKLVNWEFANKNLTA